MSTRATTFAVVVTCYNYKDYVAEAVDSALAQSRAASQIIVVDDGSTDGSTELLRERYGNDPRIALVCVENGGQLSAFQQGLAKVEADAVCFLDADDHWSPDYLEKVGAVFDQRRDVDFIFTDIQLFGVQQRTAAYADRAIDCGYTAISTYMLAHWYGAPTSALSLRTAWARRALDLPPELARTWRICADNCLVYGASVLGARKYFLPTGAVHYRTHGNNGWWGKHSPDTEFLNRYRSRCLIEYYAASIHLTELCVEFAKYEFKTKPLPSRREARRYAGLVMRRRTGRFKNLERAVATLVRGWRCRRTAAVEFSNPP